jgi:VanZ family protein
MLTTLINFINNWYISLFFFLQIPPVVFLINHYKLKHPNYVNLPYILGVFGVVFLFQKQIFKKKIGRFLPIAGYFIIISLLSHATIKTHKFIPGNRFHPIEYAALAALFAYCYQGTLKILNVKQILFLSLTCLALAFLDELHQYFIPSRVCEFNDIILDSAGIFTGIILFQFLSFLSKKTELSLD